MGFRYGSLVEDLYTSCQLQSEGWKSVYCNPKRPAFLGKSPINLHDCLNQTMRWSVGLLEVAFSRYCPITFGVRSIGLLSGLCYAFCTFWAIWAIPITIYAFLPQLALLNSASIFPKVCITIHPLPSYYQANIYLKNSTWFSRHQILGFGCMWLFSLEPMDKSISSMYYPAGRHKGG